MPYYRHKAEKVLYSVTDDPVIQSATHKGKHAGWTISGTREITYAVNPTDPATGGLTKPTMEAAVSCFEAKDSKEEALREYFRRWAPDNSIAIAADEYRQLCAEYLQIR